MNNFPQCFLSNTTRKKNPQQNTVAAFHLYIARGHAFTVYNHRYTLIEVQSCKQTCYYSATLEECTSLVPCSAKKSCCFRLFPELRCCYFRFWKNIIENNSLSQFSIVLFFLFTFIINSDSLIVNVYIWCCSVGGLDLEPWQQCTCRPCSTHRHPHCITQVQFS